MTKVTLSLLAASTLLLASPSHSGGEFATLNTFINDVIDNTNQIDFANSGKTLGATGIFVFAEDVQALDIALRYNLNANVGFDARLPIVKNDFSDETGIGDFSVSTNYHFGQPESEYGTNITTLRYKTSTGDVDDRLGTDESAVTLSHTIAKDLSNGFSFHGLATYSMNSGDIEDSFALMAGTSHQCFFSENVTTNAKITYYNQDDLSAADLWIQWSSTKIITDIPLSAGIKIPLLNDYDGEDLDKTVLFYVSASNFY